MSSQTRCEPCSFTYSEEQDENDRHWETCTANLRKKYRKPFDTYNRTREVIADELVGLHQDHEVPVEAFVRAFGLIQWHCTEHEKKGGKTYIDILKTVTAADAALAPTVLLVRECIIKTLGKTEDSAVALMAIEDTFQIIAKRSWDHLPSIRRKFVLEPLLERDEEGQSDGKDDNEDQIDNKDDEENQNDDDKDDDSDEETALLALIADDAEVPEKDEDAEADSDEQAALPAPVCDDVKTARSSNKKWSKVEDTYLLQLTDRPWAKRTEIYNAHAKTQKWRQRTENAWQLRVQALKGGKKRDGDDDEQARKGGKKRGDDEAEPAADNPKVSKWTDEEVDYVRQVVLEADSWAKRTKLYNQHAAGKGWPQRTYKALTNRWHVMQKS